MLVFGHDPKEGIVAVEHHVGKEQDEMVLFVRNGGKTDTEKVSFHPYLWVTDAGLLADWSGDAEYTELEGLLDLGVLVSFKTWKELKSAVGYLKKKTHRNPSAPDAPYYMLNDPVQQYLVQSGQTLFKGMAFSDVRRMQIDIETYTAKGYDFSNPEREEDRIIAIAMADQSGWDTVLSGAELSEKELLEQFVGTLRERDPDVLEGHNFFKFDMPYIVARAKRCKVKLALGRDGSKPTIRSSRMTIAESTYSYPKAAVYGRHVMDTFFMAQAYDVSHRALESLSLKDVAVHFEVAAPDRTYLDGEAIARTFDSEPETLIDYARDDIIETRAISDILSPIYFAQAQLLPYSYQHVGVRGNATKIDALLLRAYLHKQHSVARPDARRDFAGGYTDVFFTGVARNVHHCDVRSLYPSLMLTQELGPRSDELGVFLQLLDYLRTFRLDAKQKMQKASGDRKAYLDALQTTFKVLINSFYGYLGFHMARFSDFDHAEKVAAEGRKLLEFMIEWLREEHAEPIEIDTDGIYFVPPEYENRKELEAFRKRMQEALPEGIEIEFDGEYEAMFSYKMKNYALLEKNGELVIKGAALKSRGLEPFQRAFLRDMLRLKLEGRGEEIEALKNEYGQAILRGKWPIQKLAKTEQLQDAPSTYESKIKAKKRGRNAAYELALASDREYTAGDRIAYYVTGNKKSVPVYANAKPVSEWNPDQRDENVPYYLAKLDALYKKFVD
jgi:DNA polymerase elongation subunit (family B)